MDENCQKHENWKMLRIDDQAYDRIRPKDLVAHNWGCIEIR